MEVVLPTLAGRGAYVAADQALSSLTNFGLSFVVMRTVGAEEFGAFTLALSVYFLTLGIGRALCGEPHVVRYSHTTMEEWRHSAASATGVAVWLGTIVAALLLSSSFLMETTLAMTFEVLAVALPGLLLQDAWRYAFFSAGRPDKALVNDFIWTLLQVGLIGWLLFTGTKSSSPFLLAWGASGTLSGVFGIVQTRSWPSLTKAYSWLSSHRDLGPRFTAEFLLGLGTAQLMFLAIAAISGLAAVGALNAARVLLGPFNVIVLGVMGFAVPEGVRILHASPHRLVPATRILGLTLSLFGITCGAAVLLVPGSIGASLVGDIWPQARRLVPLLTIYLAAAGAAEGARVGLRIIASSRRSLGARLMSAPLLLSGGLMGSSAADALGAAAGIAAAHCVGAVIWWRQFRKARTETRGPQYFPHA